MSDSIIPQKFIFQNDCYIQLNRVKSATPKTRCVSWYAFMLVDSDLTNIIVDYDSDLQDATIPKEWNY